MRKLNENETFVASPDAAIIYRSGVSKKTSRPYQMPIVLIDTPWGTVELTPDRNSRASVILDMICSEHIDDNN